mmetsp:Transcript_33177/g.59380  ORF Transcript_33177/g.59380 Transcript_33177/m.59380 type:complete len:203 (-) Transcript_33177:3128-3736(-)
MVYGVWCMEAANVLRILQIEQPLLFLCHLGFIPPPPPHPLQSLLLPFHSAVLLLDLGTHLHRLVERPQGPLPPPHQQVPHHRSRPQWASRPPSHPQFPRRASRPPSHPQFPRRASHPPSHPQFPRRASRLLPPAIHPPGQLSQAPPPLGTRGPAVAPPRLSLQSAAVGSLRPPPDWNHHQQWPGSGVTLHVWPGWPRAALAP